MNIISIRIIIFITFMAVVTCLDMFAISYHGTNFFIGLSRRKRIGAEVYYFQRFSAFKTIKTLNKNIPDSTGLSTADSGIPVESGSCKLS